MEESAVLAPEVSNDLAQTSLASLRARDFRNLRALDLDMPPEGAVLVGANGQGKTNILEAIRYVTTLRSARGARDVDLVRHGETAFHLGARANGAAERTISVGFDRASGRKIVKVDNVGTSRLSDAFGTIMSVLVSPSDSQVISGGPGDRRRLLDVMLSLTDPDYLAALQKYRAALMRRNAVLRDTARNGGGDAQIAIWEPAMAECGSIIWRKRSQWCARAAPELRRLCRLMGETGEAWLAHVLHAGGASPDVTELSRALEAHRTIDMRSGRSGIGPHRDDLRITLDGSEFRQFGSGGQIRTAAVALRLLETYTIRTRQERWPVLLLDDPFAELDSERAERILALVESSGHGQVILAVPRNEDVPEGFSGLARWRVRAGTVEGDRIG